MLSYLTTATAVIILAATPIAAQTVVGGTAGGVQGRDVSASTCGSGRTDGSSIGIAGCADAAALNGGTADTSTRANVNDRRAMQRSVATARDEDERARSMTRTSVRDGEVVRSRTMSMYKEKGERPVREVETIRATPDGTTARGKRK